MSSGSGNKSASETAKRITAKQASCISTSGFLKLSEIRRHENTVSRGSRPVRMGELESSSLIGMFDAHLRLLSDLRSITGHYPWRKQSRRLLLQRGKRGMQLPLLRLRDRGASVRHGTPAPSGTGAALGQSVLGKPGGCLGARHSSQILISGARTKALFLGPA